jgi:3-methyladenine DNA glycosylase Mpg
LAERELAWSPRIGLTVGIEQEWRCYAADSDAVSGRRLTGAGSASEPPLSARAR